MAARLDFTAPEWEALTSHLLQDELEQAAYCLAEPVVQGHVLRLLVGGVDDEGCLGEMPVGVVGSGGNRSQDSHEVRRLRSGSTYEFETDVLLQTSLNRVVAGTGADVDAEMPKVEIARHIAGEPG